jgi:hypothetical protein
MKKDKMVKACSTHRKGENYTQHFFLLERLKGENNFEKPTFGWKFKIKMGLREIGYKVLGGTHFAEGRNKCWAVVNEVMNIRVP